MLYLQDHSTLGYYTKIPGFIFNNTNEKKKIRQSVHCTYIIRNNDMNKMKTEINLPIINQDNIIIRYVSIVKK